MYYNILIFIYTSNNLIIQSWRNNILTSINHILERESAFRRVGLFNFSAPSFLLGRQSFSLSCFFSTEQRACLIKARTPRLVAKQMQHITNVHHLPLSATTPCWIIPSRVPLALRELRVSFDQLREDVLSPSP